MAESSTSLGSIATPLTDTNESLVNENHAKSSSSPSSYLDNDFGLSSKLVSDELLYWWQLVGYVFLCGGIGIAGIIANVINIMVFFRQGILKDSNTISLTALSFSDLISVAALLVLSFGFAMVYLKPPGINFDPMGIAVVAGGRPHVWFVQITGWITVYIAFERCMCVVFPFKVGVMFTPKRTLMIILTMFVIVTSYGYIPLFIVEHLRWRTNSNTNRTMFRLYRTDDYATVMNVCSILNAPVSRTVTLTLVFCFSQITAFRVDASRKWRASTTVSNTQIQSDKDLKDKDDSNDMSNRDRRLVKMIRAICIIFLVCLTPNLMFMIAKFIEPEIKPRGRYNNLFFVQYVLSFFLEGVNATINICVYYSMSTKYRRSFRSLFRMKEADS